MIPARKYIHAAVCLLLIFFVSKWTYYTQFTNSAFTSLSLHYDDGINYDNSSIIYEDMSKDFYDITFWSEHDKQFKYTVINYKGNLEALLPYKILSGSFPIFSKNSKIDKCVISSTLSYEKWGSLDTVGKIFIESNKNYIVAGIFDCNKKIIALLNNQTYEGVYKFIELTGYNRHDMDVLSSLRVSKNLPNYSRAVNYGLISSVISYISCVPMILIFLTLFIKLILRNIKLKIIKSHFIVITCWGIFITFILLIVFNAYPLSDYFIPSKWSNFEHWDNLFREINLQIYTIISYGGNIKSILFQESAFYVFFYAICACTIQMSLCFLFAIRSSYEIFTKTLLSLSMTMLMFILFENCVQAFVPNILCWIYYPTVLIMQYMIRFLTKYKVDKLLLNNNQIDSKLIKRKRQKERVRAAVGEEAPDNAVRGYRGINLVPLRQRDDDIGY